MSKLEPAGFSGFCGQSTKKVGFVLILKNFLFGPKTPENHLKWIFVRLGKCSSSFCSSFLKLAFLHGLQCKLYTLELIQN